MLSLINSKRPKITFESPIDQEVEVPISKQIEVPIVMTMDVPIKRRLRRRYP